MWDLMEIKTGGTKMAFWKEVFEKDDLEELFFFVHAFMIRPNKRKVNNYV